MCRVGHSNWLFTDSSACYLSNSVDGRFRKCICPFTTCTETTEGYGCHLTSSVMILAGFIMAVWMCAAGAYVYVMNTIGNMELEARTEMDLSMRHNYYCNKLFGNPSTPTQTEKEVLATVSTSKIAEFNNNSNTKNNVSKSENRSLLKS